MQVSAPLLHGYVHAELAGTTDWQLPDRAKAMLKDLIRLAKAAYLPSAPSSLGKRSTRDEAPSPAVPDTTPPAGE